MSVNPDKVVENSVLKIGTVCAILIFLVSITWKVFDFTKADALWKQKNELTLSNIEYRINESGWSRKQMRTYLAAFRKANPDLEIPDIDSIP